MELLTILKMLAEGCTAGFGILGLLSEGHKEKRRHRQIALWGIIASFAMSVVVAYFEGREKRLQDQAHVEEVKKLSHLIGGDIWARVGLTYTTDSSNDLFNDRQELVAFFRRFQPNHLGEKSSVMPMIDNPGPVIPENAVPIGYSVHQSDLRRLTRQKAPLDDFDSPVDYSVEVFRSATCESLARVSKKPDLILMFEDIRLADDTSVLWSYRKQGDVISMDRRLKLRAVRMTPEFVSIDNFSGSAVVIWLGQEDVVLTLSQFGMELNGAAFGADKFVPVEGKPFVSFRTGDERLNKGNCFVPRQDAIN